MAVSVIPFSFPVLDNVGCLFQRRTTSLPCDGTIAYNGPFDPADVELNRRELLKTAGVSAIAEMHQVHGDVMLYEPDPVPMEKGPLPDCDGLATSRPGLALMVKTADCQPLLVAHKSGRYVAGLHAGWRGVRQLFPYTGVKSFCEHYNISPRDCLAVRGPSLGPARSEFIHFTTDWGGYFRRYLDLTTSTMDMWSMTKDQLLDAGIPARQIFGLDLCTASNADQFFSYRVDKNCGRQASLIWIKEA